MINGNTRLYAIVADPISQVRTPQVLNTYFQSHGQDAVLVPVHVAPDSLEAVVNGFRQTKNLDGFIVTVPHKTAVAALCDTLGPAAQATGSVNTVRRTADGRLIGDMFDGAGFVQGLRSQDRDPAGKRILLLGAGGAAGAIAFSLIEAGAAHVTIANRTESKATTVVDRVRKAFPAADICTGKADPRGFDIVVNATSLGMKADDALPLQIDLLHADTVVAEIIMKPELTPLLEQAQKHGCPIHFGRHMLDQQVQLMVNFMQQC